MTTLDSLPDEILRSIVKGFHSAFEREGDFTFFNLAYLNDKYRIMTLEVFHNQNSDNWSKKTRTKKMGKMRDVEALALVQAIADLPDLPYLNSKAQYAVKFHERCNKLKTFDRAERVEKRLDHYVQFVLKDKLASYPARARKSAHYYESKYGIFDLRYGWLKHQLNH
jgi:hypothetical protein